MGLEHILDIRGTQQHALTTQRHPAMIRSHLQMCDVVHDGPAFDGVSLCVDEMEVDLRKKKKLMKDCTGLHHYNEEHSLPQTHLFWWRITVDNI